LKAIHKFGAAMQELMTTPSPIGEDRIREAFQYAASGMAIMDLHGNFEETNPAYREIVGRTQAELQDQTVLSITHTEDRANCARHLDGLVSGRTDSFILEKRYLRPDGTPIWVRNSFSLLKDKYGYSNHVIMICNDVSERRRAEQLLVESEKLAVVGQLAACIAHEINNPLEAVLNLLYLVREAETLEEAHGFATQATEEVQRVAQIASHTLQFHREQSKAGMTDIVSVIDSVLALFKGKLALGNINVHIEAKDSPQLVCFPGEIRQVLANLLRNSIEAMPRGGTLYLRVRHATDWRSGERGVRMTIADTGYGMNAQTRSRIYEPFFTTKGLQGTGLGLWITAGIVAKHKGSMHLRSRDTSPTTGTAFTLIFPDDGAQ
jgi:PAS domain S-box-containing protein